MFGIETWSQRQCIGFVGVGRERNKDRELESISVICVCGQESREGLRVRSSVTACDMCILSRNQERGSESLGVRCWHFEKKYEGSLHLLAKRSGCMLTK